MIGSFVSCRKVLSKIATNRFQKELTEWQINPPGFTHRVTDNLQRYVIEVNGAQGTIYANEKYQLQVDFLENYPMEAPEVIFFNPAPLHPHIFSNAHICLGGLFGVYLPDFVFSHGQLYAALSRGISRASTKVLVKRIKHFDREGVYTSNVVYGEVLRDE